MPAADSGHAPEASPRLSATENQERSFSRRCLSSSHPVSGTFVVLTRHLERHHARQAEPRWLATGQAVDRDRWPPPIWKGIASVSCSIGLYGVRARVMSARRGSLPVHGRDASPATPAAPGYSRYNLCSRIYCQTRAGTIPLMSCPARTPARIAVPDSGYVSIASSGRMESIRRLAFRYPKCSLR